ncbi:MAG: nucleotidyl transferase AbiEii/AbiGii toxin family protein [Desulfuromonadaceae bacterium]
MLIQKLNQSLDLLTALRDEGHIAGFALIGGLAVSAWSRARATMDVDMLVIVQSSKLDYLVEKLCEAGMNAEFRRGGVDDPIPLLIRADSLDIIVATKKFEAETIEQSVVTQIAGRDIPVASPEYLIILKLKAGGPRDLLDVRELLASNLVDQALLAELASRYRVDQLLHEVTR